MVVPGFAAPARARPRAHPVPPHAVPVQEPARGAALQPVLFTRMVTVSDSVRDTLLGCGVPPDKVEVIHHGTDVEAFARTTQSAAKRPRASWASPRTASPSASSGASPRRRATGAAGAAADAGRPLPAALRRHRQRAGRGRRCASRSQDTGPGGPGALHRLPRRCQQRHQRAGHRRPCRPPGTSRVPPWCSRRWRCPSPSSARAPAGRRRWSLEGETGLLVPPSDADALADAVARWPATPSCASAWGGGPGARRSAVLAARDDRQDRGAVPARVRRTRAGRGRCRKALAS